MKRWSILLLCSTAFTGCQQTDHRVIERLPHPYHAELSRGLLTPLPAPRSEPPAAPSPVEGWMPPQLSNRWQCIVIHHTASDTGSLLDVDRWHRDQGWDGCGYHFVIGNGTGSRDGLIEPSARWHGQATGAHTRLVSARPENHNYYNEHGIGIVMVGNFEKTHVTVRQMESLAQLIRFLTETCSIPESKVYVHSDLKVTDCPGRHFSKAELLRRVRGLP